MKRNNSGATLRHDIVYKPDYNNNNNNNINDNNERRGANDNINYKEQGINVGWEWVDRGGGATYEKGSRQINNENTKDIDVHNKGSGIKGVNPKGLAISSSKHEFTDSSIRGSASKVTNLAGKYGFGRERITNEESDTNRALLVATKGNLGINVLEGLRQNLDGLPSIDTSAADAVKTQNDSRWASLSTLHRRGDARLKLPSQKIDPLNGRESQEEIDDIIASGDPDLSQDNILDLWDVDEVNVKTKAGISHLHEMAARGKIFIMDSAPGHDMSRDSVGLLKALGKDGVMNILLDLARGCDATLSIMEGARRKWVSAGPYSGDKMHYDSVRGTLRITTKKKVEVKSLPVSEPSLSGSSLKLDRAGDEREDDEVEEVSVGCLPQYDDFANPIEDECIVIPALTPDRTSALPIFEESPGVKDWTMECKVWKGAEYPPPGINAKFAGSLAKLRIGPSPIQGDGVFARSKLIRGELFGYYEGIDTDRKGPYVMKIFSRNIDGAPEALGRISLYAMINEDLYGGVPNVEVLPGGLFRALRDIKVGEELVIRYGAGYAWDCLKDLSLQALTQEVTAIIPSMWGVIPNIWAELKRRQDPLCRWISKLIEGKHQPTSLHSSSNSDQLDSPKLELARLISSGPFSRKFNFRIFGKEIGRRWRCQKYDRNWEARKSYSSCWNGTSLMDIPFEKVMEENEPVRSLVGVLENATLKIGDTRLREEPRITENSGEVRVSIRFGLRKKESLISGANSCKSLDQLRVWALSQKIWRVSYRNNPVDDNYPGGGWCGYLAYDQIRRNAPTWADIKSPRDISKLVGTLSELVKFGPGIVRTNWKSLKAGVLKLPKEVVLSVIETLQQSSQFFPTPQLRIERWIPMILINGSCEKLKYSIWALDPEDENYNWLQEGPRSRGGVTNYGEWEEILGNRMMTGRRNHFHVRESGLQSDLGRATNKAILRLATILGLSLSEPAAPLEIRGVIRPELSRNDDSTEEMGLPETPGEGLVQPTSGTGLTPTTAGGETDPNFLDADGLASITLVTLVGSSSPTSATVVGLAPPTSATGVGLAPSSSATVDMSSSSSSSTVVGLPPPTSATVVGLASSTSATVVGLSPSSSTVVGLAPPTSATAVGSFPLTLGIEVDMAPPTFEVECAASAIGERSLVSDFPGIAAHTRAPEPKQDSYVNLIPEDKEDIPNVPMDDTDKTTSSDGAAAEHFKEPTAVNPLLPPIIVSSNKELAAKLKIVFWNSNCWNSVNCEKVAETARNSDADVICVTDARSDASKARYMNGYLSTLKKATGRIWRGKIEARAGRKSKCVVGGDIIFFSDRCTKVVKTAILPLGVASCLKLTWGGQDFRIVSVYRPYDSPESAVGSLRNVSKKLTVDFEEAFWQLILGNSEVTTVIGGDFNMEGGEVDARIHDSSFSRAHYNERTSFRKLHLGSYRGAAIDHVLANRPGVESQVSSDGLYLGDHFPVIASITTSALVKAEKELIEVKAPPRIKSTDKGGLRRLSRALEKKYSGDLSLYSMVSITDWTVREERRIAASRISKSNPNGWSPTARVLKIRLRVLGALLKRKLDGAEILSCRNMYDDARRDLTRIRLTDDELEWLETNDVPSRLPPWSTWVKENPIASLTQVVTHLKSLSTRVIRDELRLLHGGRMRRIQDAADAGRIGPILKSIMSKSNSFSLDVLYDKDGNITDPDEVARIVTEFFKKWFDSSDEDEVRDDQVAKFSAAGNEKGWFDLSEKLGIPWNHAKEVLEGMRDKESNEAIKKESTELDNYVPTLEEFNSYIKTLNPNSAGGPSGLTYLLVQQWPANVRERVHGALSEAWKSRTSVPGWGRRWLQPIPKVQDPSLDELRPLMLVEVTRKIWVGLIMAKIAGFWSRNNLIDEAQHAYIRGKGTHSALPQLTACLEAAREYKTDIYISSWDMKRAFDSLGKRFIIRSLMRLHIPAGLAIFLTSLDEGGNVFVKCPKNMKIAERGLASLDLEGDKFQTMRGTGQGDIPSPLLWVAAMDTLLTILRNNKSEFKIQDLNGQSHPVESIAFADDVLSIESTMEALQAKAHLISAWCILTGIEISHTKLRNFGVHWGVHKIDPPLLVHSKRWVRRVGKKKPGGPFLFFRTAQDPNGKNA